VRGAGPDPTAELGLADAPACRPRRSTGALGTPADYAQAALANGQEETVKKVLQDTAARIYGVEV